MEDNRAYACAYRLVSATCNLLQFAATTIRLICSALQFRTACFSSSSRTFNPKVAGSSPARPTQTLHEPSAVLSRLLERFQELAGSERWDDLSEAEQVRVT
jgi:hypothetical protein